MADLRICFLGDSFVQGTGDETCLGWPGRVCASAPSRRHGVTMLARRYAEVCASLSVPFLDLVEPLRRADVWWHEVADGDGIHPDAHGFAAIARLVEAWPAWQAWLP